jgi:tetratricopeptide (TPR) repeat protein
MALLRVIGIFVVATLAQIPESIFAQSATYDAAEPVVKSRDWKRLQAPDLLVVGNARAEDLRRTAEEIERFRQAIRALAPNFPMDSPVPTVAVVFRDDGVLSPFKPRRRGKPDDNVAAYFAASADINYIVLAPSANREFTYQVIFHEYTHFLLSQSSPRLPRWLNEGLAEFYSTFNGSDLDDRTIIGRPIPRHVARLREVGGFIPLKKFLDRASLAELLNDQRNVQRFYAEAWALTHFLILGDKGAYQPKLREFMAATRTSESPEQAFQRIFAQDLTAIETGMRRAVNSMAMPALQLPRVDVQIDGTIAQMAEVDAQQVQADLLVHQGAFDDAEKPLAKAAALDPQHVALRLSRVKQLIGTDRLDAALEMLSAPDLASAKDFPTAFLKAEALRLAKRYDESIAAYEQAISAHRLSAPAYFGLSLSQLAVGSVQAAASFSHCLAIRPGSDWFISRLYAAQRIGRDEFALADARSYVTLEGWRDTSSPYVMYVAALAAMRIARTDRANELLDEIAANVDPKSWQAAIVEYLRGRLAPDAFLKKASPDELLTEAHAYIGIKAHIDGDRATALQHLQWVKEKGRRDYTEYGLALGELDRIAREEAPGPAR